MDDELRWKEQLHAQWTTPPDVLNRLVLRATGSAPAERSRIIGGEGNEVWSIRTNSGIYLILRISRSGSYSTEQWATEQARTMGVPAPEILLVDNAVPVLYSDATSEPAEAAEPGKVGGDTEGRRGKEGRVAAWIHRAIPGEPLHTVTDARQARLLTAQAGLELARIHSVSMTGCGWIEAHEASDAGVRTAQGILDNFSDYLLWDESAADAAALCGIERADVSRAAQLIDAARHVWKMTPSLLHGDWLPEHVLVHARHGAGTPPDPAVAGIIDFGNTRSGDPAYDIAYWQFFWDAEHYPTSALVEGYRRQADPGPLLDVRVRLCRLSLSMRALRYYAAAGRSFPAQHAAQRFREALFAL